MNRSTPRKAQNKNPLNIDGVFSATTSDVESGYFSAKTSSIATFKASNCSRSSRLKRAPFTACRLRVHLLTAAGRRGHTGAAGGGRGGDNTFLFGLASHTDVKLTVAGQSPQHRLLIRRCAGDFKQGAPGDRSTNIIGEIGQNDSGKGEDFQQAADLYGAFPNCAATSCCFSPRCRINRSRPRASSSGVRSTRCRFSTKAAVSASPSKRRATILVQPASRAARQRRSPATST